MSTPTAEAQWAPDPFGGVSWRWWDGTRWTDQTAPAQPPRPLVPLRACVGQALVLEQQKGSGTDELRRADGGVLSPEGAPLVGVRLDWPPPKEKQILGMSFRYSTTTSGTGATSATVTVEIHEAAAETAELPLLALFAAFLGWWVASVHERAHTL